jgi:hypothetical protein
MTPPTLSRRALNRALLERQLLLRRVEMSAEDAVRHLVALQAQNVYDPYYALWSRLKAFQPAELASLLVERRVVRAVSMLRTTIHLVTADDWLALRPILAPVSERGFRTGSPYGRRLSGIDIEAVVRVGRQLLDERPRTSGALGKALQERWPDADPTALGYAVRALVPLVQATPRAVWGRSGQPVLATPETWLRRSEGTATDPSALILRYLRAFGPASVMDIQAWSWLTRLRPDVERLRPHLRTFRDETGRELFDVPDGPLPDPEHPAPVRFMPAFDNAAIGHKDRSRIGGDPATEWLIGRSQWDDVFYYGSVLVDGFISAGWRMDRDPKAGRATVVVRPVKRFTADQRAEIEAEAGALLAFAEPESTARDVRFEDPA